MAGPINPEPEGEEPVFHTNGKVLGLPSAKATLGKWNIDMARHARERQHPIDYLRHTITKTARAENCLSNGPVTAEELAIGAPRVQQTT